MWSGTSQGGAMDRKVVAAGVAALALALASCGESAEPLTRAEFTRQAGAICAKREAAYAAAVTKAGDDVLGRIRLAMPALERSVAQLEELEPPAGLRDHYDEIMRTEREQIAVGREALKGRIREAEHGRALHDHERMRTQLGMTRCN